MITSINTSSYALRASMNTTVRTESAEKTEFMSEDDKLDTIIRFFRYAPAPVQSARCSVA